MALCWVRRSKKNERPGKKYGYLAWILIDEEFQGIRIGKRLYREPEKRCRNDDVRMVLVETSADNDDAIVFFK
ncbi:MAG: GNAT family N-acetyltransferase [Chloroflexi bacterium]|nr:GNAT family N-acetyltransferase [Chloroflexota bacterium]